MAKVAVIGAGHAGVEAAFVLAKRGHSVTLFTNEAHLPYFRPRLLSVAFGTASPESLAIKPATAYAQAGIDVRQQSVKVVDLPTRRVDDEVFDGIVVAQGAKPFVPPFKGDVARVRTLWNMADALAMRERAKAIRTLVIIGGGVLGLEAAIRAVAQGLHVTVVENALALLGGILGEGAGKTLQKALEDKGICVLCGVAVASIEANTVVLADGKCIAADEVLCATGARPNTDLAQVVGMPLYNGVTTQADLSVAPGVYVAGDQANPTGQRPLCAVMRALKMGTLAATNLAEALENRPSQSWSEPLLPLFMKVDDIEFHTQGDCLSADLSEERLDDGSDERIWKSLLRRGEAIVGLRWVGTRMGFADWSKQLSNG